MILILCSYLDLVNHNPDCENYQPIVIGFISSTTFFMAILSIMAAISFTVILILIKTKAKIQRELNLLKKSVKGTSIYEDIIDLYPQNINTDGNVAYGNIAHSQKPVDTTYSQKTILPVTITVI